MAAPKVDQAYLRAAASAREQLNTLIQQDKLAGPAFIRLAFNDALTYDKTSNTCGANGSIRTAKELAQPGNTGLKGAADYIKGLKAKFNVLSHADLIQLAAVAAIAAVGGPEVQLALGRADSWGYPPPGRLPDPASSEDPVAHLRALASRLGLELRQLVALAGVHPLCGRWWPGTAVPEDSPLRFSNAYFRHVLLGRTDAWLPEDAEISRLVAEFAADEEAFAKEYALAHEVLSRLGTKLPAPAQGGAGAQPASGYSLLAESSWAQAALAAAGVAVGVAVAAGVYWRIRRRRRLGI